MLRFQYWKYWYWKYWKHQFDFPAGLFAAPVLGARLQHGLVIGQRIDQIAGEDDDQRRREIGGEGEGDKK